MRQSASKKSAASPECESESNKLNLSGSSSSSSKARKRKHCEILRFSDLESEFEDCDLEDAVALETKLRKVARRNSLSHDEMMKLLHKFVKNEHILALVTLKAEDELAREKVKAEQRAIIITETPSIPKLTRAKAKQLNKQPVISLPKLLGAEQTEIATLIHEELNSDEEDEEYTFKEEDFVSDDDPNTTASDLDSNPRTPQNSAIPAETDDSPVKLSEDGCFKVPLNKKEQQEELRIATRTRSKLCLQQTAIEDIESEFVPPDLELTEGTEPDPQFIDEEWNQFLTDFLKPLSSSLVGDDDDPINDPEYIAAEKEKVDAEELRDVNISKKEIAELMTELLSNLNEGISFESIELETPRKFLLSYQDDQLNTPNTSPEKGEDNPDVSRQLHFEEAQTPHESLSQSCAITSSNNVTQQNISFHPDVMSTPSTHNTQHNVQSAESQNMTVIPVAMPNQDASYSNCSTVAIPTSNLNTQVDLIALPIPGHPNRFQLAKVVNSAADNRVTKKISEQSFLKEKSRNSAVAARYSVPYETNYTGEYISVRRHAIAEHIEKFESLKNAQVNQISSTTADNESSESHKSPGFTKYQYDLLQQQLRIHVQTLTQTYVQTYCHPELWKMANKPREMLLELQTKSRTNNNFKIWNLEKAVDLINKWKEELDEDTEDNKELMKFLHREVELTNHNTRQIPRFHPRMMDCFLESDVFMYPQYLPRMPFSPKVLTYEVFSPVESYLIAMGLEKHMKIIAEKKERIPNKSTPIRLACKRLTKDTLSGKHHRRVWDHIEHLKKAEYYNPIQYYFEHNKAPVVEPTPIIGFQNNTVLAPKDRVPELPLVFQTYLEKKNAPPKTRSSRKTVTNPRVKASDTFRNSYLEFVREAVGEDITLPTEEASEPDTCASEAIQHTSESVTARKRKASKENQPRAKRRVPHSLTINVNYVFGSPTSNVLNSSASFLPAILPISYASPPNNTITKTVVPVGNRLLDSTINEDLNSTIDNINQRLISNDCATDTPVITYNFDLTTKTLQPSHKTVTISNPLQNLPPSNQTIADSTPEATQTSSTNALQSAIATEEVVGQSSQVSTTTSPQTLPPSNQNNSTTSSQGTLQTSLQEVCSFPQETEEPEHYPQANETTNYFQPLEEPPQSVTSSESIQTAALENIYGSERTAIGVRNNDKQDANEDNKNRVLKVNGPKGKGRKRTPIFSYITKLNRNISKKSVVYREKRQIKQRCEDLITAYGLHLSTLQIRHQHSPIVQHYYQRFKALELYTNLLKSLKMFCNKNSNTNSGSTASASGSSPSGLKRARNSHADDDSSPSSQRMARKINRQEENFRHMLLPDTPEEANRKDAIYAFNFYEKVEESLRSSNRPDDCKKFNSILKSFDPKKDKVSDLYYKLENLFLPDHPELAQVFLTFLLPSEAAEIGKFFEHFMITNISTFINKLNIYFNKQPAQIRKIYNCLNELADDPNVTMKKIETKIIPLLKGNQFLIDWFMQQFPKSAPPERLFSTPEHILNVKEQQSSRTSEHVETITDILDSPANDNSTQPTCQLRYINGRIFYGSKMCLPAKLSFMAASYKDNRSNIQSPLSSSTPSTGCVHAIKEHGEKRLQSSTELTNIANIETTDGQDKSEEEDVSKVLVIDTTAEEDDSCSSFEPCDENTLKAHALRLNPSYYGSTCYSSNATSTPNLNSNFQNHHPNAKKVSLNFNDDLAGSAAISGGAGKTSPRKNSNQNQHSIHSPMTSACQSPLNAREKRKSPSKKTKSPLNNNAARSVRSYNQPMVVIHENNSAIQCAKRLKSLVESSLDEQTTEETLDTKEHLHIVARTKSSSSNVSSGTTSTTSSACVAVATGNNQQHHHRDVKQERSDDLEFLPENASITRSPFPALKMDTDSNEEDCCGTTNITPSTIESDEDCKINIVATLSAEPTKSNDSSGAPLPLNSAWTRDEDKIILIEMKLGSANREELHQRISQKLTQRTLFEIKSRHQFLMDFLSKLQGK